MPSSKNQPSRHRQKKLKKSDLLAADINSLDWNYRLPVGQLSEVQRMHRAEYRKKRPSIVRHLGHAALDSIAGVALVAANPVEITRALSAGLKGDANGTQQEAKRQYINQANERYEKARKSKNPLRHVGHMVTDIAVNRLAKRELRRAKRDELWQATHKTAANEFRKKNPDIAKHELALQEQRLELDARMERGRAIGDPVRRGQDTTEYFKRGNIYSFSKNIPRSGQKVWGGYKFEGEYGDLAKAVLKTASTKRRADGATPLLGGELQAQRVLARESAGEDMNSIHGGEELYVRGATTALWQLGFVQYEETKDVFTGKGEMNPDTIWATTAEDTRIAQIPFNPDNELHQMLMPAGKSYENPMIQLEMNAFDATNSYAAQGRDSFMDIRIAEALPVAEAA